MHISTACTEMDADTATVTCDNILGVTVRDSWRNRWVSLVLETKDGEIIITAVETKVAEAMRDAFNAAK